MKHTDKPNNQKGIFIALFVFFMMIAAFAEGQSGNFNQPIILPSDSTGQTTAAPSMPPHRTCGSHAMYQQQMAWPGAAAEMEKLETITKSLSQMGNRASNAKFTIPVVFHIIHNGEAVGKGNNISLDQIEGQVYVLNWSYTATNTDLPKGNEPWAGFVGNMNTEFVLATEDPDGNPTNGITRHYGSSTKAWTQAQVETYVKPQTIWPRADYMNIWVLPAFAGKDSNMLAYATWPSISTDFNDGVAIINECVGFEGTAKYPYGLGITLVHETGHYLNLHHPNGDAACGNDLVDDTPPQQNYIYDCEAYPFNPNSNCGSNTQGEMVPNFMQYCDDLCLTFFSKGQVQRVRAAITVTRKSLLTSHGLNVPVNEGIADMAPKTMAIYPNPANSSITISTSQAATANIYNTLGQLVATLPTNGAIDISMLPAGVYYVVATGKTMQRGRFVKQ